MNSSSTRSFYNSFLLFISLRLDTYRYNAMQCPYAISHTTAPVQLLAVAHWRCHCHATLHCTGSLHTPQSIIAHTPPPPCPQRHSNQPCRLVAFPQTTVLECPTVTHSGTTYTLAQEPSNLFASRNQQPSSCATGRMSNHGRGLDTSDFMPTHIHIPFLNALSCLE